MIIRGRYPKSKRSSKPAPRRRRSNYRYTTIVLYKRFEHEMDGLDDPERLLEFDSVKDAAQFFVDTKRCTNLQAAQSGLYQILNDRAYSFHGFELSCAGYDQCTGELIGEEAQSYE